MRRISLAMRSVKGPKDRYLRALAFRTNSATRCGGDSSEYLARGDPVAGARAQPFLARNVALTDVRASRSGVCGANAQGARRCTRGCRPRIDADVHIPEHVERQIGSNSLDGRDRVVLAADPPPRRSMHRLLDHACDSVQRVRRSGCRTTWRLCRRQELLPGVSKFRFRKTGPAATISIVAHAEAMKQPLRRRPRAAPRPGKLLSIPPVARHLAARAFFARPLGSDSLDPTPFVGPAPIPLA